VSPHGVLSGSGGCVHCPVCGLHGGSWVHWLVSGWQTVVLWVWMHWPISQPAVVQAFWSVSPHGVLSGLLSFTQPVTRSVAALNCTVFEIVEHPGTPALHRSLPRTLPWLMSGSGSSGWIT